MVAVLPRTKEPCVVPCVPIVSVDVPLVVIAVVSPTVAELSKSRRAVVPLAIGVELIVIN